MKVAYFVLAHTDAGHFGRLVRAIDYRADIFAHIDQKATTDPFIDAARGLKVRFAPRRRRIYWAGFNQITVTLDFFRAALATGENYSHLVLLSGADYPIKPIQSFYEHLLKNRDRELIRIVRMDASPSLYRRHYLCRSYMDPVPVIPEGLVNKALRKGVLNRISLMCPRQPLPGVACFGSAFFAISPSCAHYILRYTTENPSFSRFYRRTFAPDEQFFHTIIANSDFLNRTAGIEAVPIDMAERYPLPSFHHTMHPAIRKIYASDGDFEDLMNSDKFFVRKVASERSGSLLDRIDLAIGRSTRALP